jgi:2-C-methyl-D-erythritol 2,4-cyclodiphosphate synthase
MVQADLTILTELPRLQPHLAPMAASLAARLALPTGAINVKAKTNEGMGFIGRGEGLAVMAVALLEAR